MFKKHVDLSIWTFLCYPTNSSNPGDKICFKFYIFFSKMEMRGESLVTSKKNNCI